MKNFLLFGKEQFLTDKRKIFKVLAITLIPFIYAFTYLAAFWNPFSNLNNLKAAVVNQDNSQVMYNRLHEKIGDELTINAGNSEYKFPVKYLENNDYQNHKTDYAFALIVPTNYDQLLTNYLNTFEGNPPELVFSTSYKANYFIGEITTLSSSVFSIEAYKLLTEDIVAKLKSFDIHDVDSFTKLLENIKAKYPALEKEINILIQKLSDGTFDVADLNRFISLLDELVNNLNINNFSNLFGLSVQAEGANSIDLYGYALAPLFLCIGLWSGSVFLIGLFRRKVSSLKLNYYQEFGLTFSWMAIINFIQMLIVVGAVSLLGWHLTNQIAGFAFCYLITLTFSAIMLSIGFSIKQIDSARFIGVVLLILQITSSGGIIPLSIQPKFFQAIGYINPFKYAINGLRELYINFDGSTFGFNLGILFLFLLVAVGINFLVHYLKSIKKNPELESKIK